jgi:hypothetical protein
MQFPLLFHNGAFVMNNQPSSELLGFVTTLQNGIWYFRIALWKFGLADRSTALLSDGYLSAIDIVQLSTASFFKVSWLFLKPTPSSKAGVVND